MHDNNSSEQQIQVPVTKVNAAELIDQLCRENQSLREENESLKRLTSELKPCIDILTNTVAAQKELIQQLQDEIARLNGRPPRPKIPPSRLENNKNGGLQQRIRPLANNTIAKNSHLLWSRSRAWKKIATAGRVVAVVKIDATRPLAISTYARPVIKATKRKSSKPGQPAGKSRKKKTVLAIHEHIVIQPANLPEGAIFKGFQKYAVQDIVFESRTIQYRLARWQLADGTYVKGQLPGEIKGHYGPELVAYALHQYNSCRVPEELILQQLHDRGVLISAGQLSNILIQDKEAFHSEVDELLLSGVEAEKQIQVDDTGGRHQGTNQHTTVIGNKWFSVYVTTPSKNRVNFLRLLQNGKEEYLINEDTLEHLKEINAESYLPGYLAFYLGSKFTSSADWEQFLQARNISKESEVRHVTEAALYASVIVNGIPRDLGVHSDDAGQFNVFVHSLCWVHEERLYSKLIMTNEQSQNDLKRVRDQIWGIYNDLKKFTKSPVEGNTQAIEKLFDEIFQQKTSSPTLNKQLERSHKKKEELLRVLQRPNTPLHNNRSETDARAAKIKLKISGGTRSELGKRARDSFLSLKQTCLKLGINFYSFLQDRVRGLYKIPRLAEVIRQRSSIGASPKPLEGFT